MDDEKLKEIQEGLDKFGVFIIATFAKMVAQSMSKIAMKIEKANDGRICPTCESEDVFVYDRLGPDAQTWCPKCGQSPKGLVWKKGMKHE